MLERAGATGTLRPAGSSTRRAASASCATSTGAPSHEIIQRGLQVLVNLTHRGATGSDAETGDGAGILMQIPHAFLERECASLGIRLPEPGEYGVGTVFLPQRRRAARARCEALIERTVADEGQHFLGWRDVPVHPEHIGDTARASHADDPPVLRAARQRPRRRRASSASCS